MRVYILSEFRTARERTVEAWQFCVLCELLEGVFFEWKSEAVVETRSRHGELLRHLQRSERRLGSGHRPGELTFYYHILSRKGEFKLFIPRQNSRMYNRDGSRFRAFRTNRIPIKLIINNCCSDRPCFVIKVPASVKKINRCTAHDSRVSQRGKLHSCILVANS